MADLAGKDEDEDGGVILAPVNAGPGCHIRTTGRLMRSACAELWCNDSRRRGRGALGPSLTVSTVFAGAPSSSSSPHIRHAGAISGCSDGVSFAGSASPSHLRVFVSPLHLLVRHLAHPNQCACPRPRFAHLASIHPHASPFPCAPQSNPSILFPGLLLHSACCACCFGVTPRQTLSCPNEIYFQTLSVAC